MSKLKDCLKKIKGLHKEDIADLKRLAIEHGNEAKAVELMAFDADQEIMKTRKEVGAADPVVTKVKTAEPVTDTGNKVKGAYDKASNVITLIKNASDMSTIHHELFHYFRPLLADAAPHSPRIRRMIEGMEEFTKSISTVDNLKTFYGNKKIKQLGKTVNELKDQEEIDKALTIVKEEMLAKAYERYITEGNAPSVPLMNVFNKFREWQVHLYKGIRTLPGIKINDNIRKAFDTMLATEAEVEEMNVLYGQEKDIRALLPKKKEAIKQDAKEEEDTNKEDDEIDKLKNAADDKVRRELEKVISNYFSPERKQKIKEEVTKEVEERRIYGIIKSLKGKLDFMTASYLIGEVKTLELSERYPEMFSKDDKKTLSLQRLNNFSLKKEPPFAHAEDLLNTIHSTPTKEDAIAQRIEEEVENIEARIRLGFEEDLIAKTSLDEDGNVVESAEAFLSEERLEYTLALWSYNLDVVNKKQTRKLERLALEKVAMEELAKMSVKEISRTNQFINASRRAAQAAVLAAKAGDVELMQKHLHLQALHIIKAKKSIQLKKETASIKKALVKLAKDKGRVLDSEYGDLIRHITNHYGLTTEELISPKNMLSLTDVATELAALESDDILLIQLTPPAWLQGYESRVEVHPQDILTGEQEPPTSKDDYKDLTLDQFNALKSYLTLIKKIKGHETFQLGEWLGKPDLTHGEVVTELMTQLAKHDPNIMQWENVSPDRKLAGIRDWIKNFAAVNAQFPIDMLLDRLDMGDKNGPFHKYILNPMIRAYGEKSDLEKQYFERFEKDFMPRIKALIDKIESKYGKEFTEVKITTPEGKERVKKLPMPEAFKKARYKGWNVNRWLTFIMNTGTANNYTTLVDGYGLTDQEVNTIMTIFDKATCLEAFDIADGVRAFLDEMFPAIDDANHRLYGQRLTKEEAVPLQVIFDDGTSHELAGGYYPELMAPDMTFKGKAISEDDITKQHNLSVQRFRQGAMSANKERTTAAYPIMLNMEGLIGHLSRSAMFSTSAPVLNDIAKVFNFKKKAGDESPAISMMESMRDVVGTDTSMDIIPWVSQVAQATPGSGNSLVQSIGVALARLAVNMLGLSLGTTLKNGTAIIKAWEKFGFMFTAKAYYEAFTGFARKDGYRMYDHVKMINELDGRMMERTFNSTQAAIQNIVRSAPSKRYNINISFGLSKAEIFNLGVEEMAKISMAPIMAMDALTTYPIYWSVYQQALRENGGDVRAAKDKAFVAVSEMQPVANPIFQNQLQRGGSRGEHKVLFRMASFMLSWAYRVTGDQRNYIYALRTGQLTPVEFVEKTTLNLFAPAVATAFISTALALKKSKEEEEDGFLKTWAKNAAWDTASNGLGGFWLSGLFLGPARYGMSMSVSSKGSKYLGNPMRDVVNIFDPPENSDKERWDYMKDLAYHLTVLGSVAANLPLENLIKQYNFFFGEDDK